jgi:hypothetical protein
MRLNATVRIALRQRTLSAKYFLLTHIVDAKQRLPVEVVQFNPIAIVKTDKSHTRACQ